MAGWQVILGAGLALVLAALLVRQAIRANARNRNMPSLLFGEASRILEHPEIGHGEAFGSYTLSGTYGSHAVRVKAITDTLAVRKLPSMWLMVTLPDSLPVRAVFDLVMRPAGPVTFSNFDHLANTLHLPAGYPEDAIIRTDDPLHVLNPVVVAPHLDDFLSRRGKELLISPKGLRMVVLLAEADRARYGVLRQAAFGDVRLDPEELRGIIIALLKLRADIDNWHRQHSS